MPCKKLLTIISFFLLSFLALANSKLTLKINSDKGIVQFIDLNSGDKNYLNFNNGSITTDLTNSRYKVIVFSPNYDNYETIIALEDEHKAFKIDLSMKSFDFFVSSYSSNSSSYSFSDTALAREHLLNINILFYKGEELVKTIYMDSPLKKINLDIGEYSLKFLREKELIYTLNSFVVEEDLEPFLNFFLNFSSIEIRGHVFREKLSLGGVDVVFTDVDNNSYTFKTDFSGRFLGYLPSRKYKVSIDRYGYKLKADQDLIYNFIDNNSFEYLDLEVVEVKSLIKGSVVDDLGETIKDASVDIKVDDKVFNLTSDSYGRFQWEVDPGIVFIKAKKDGYSHRGIVERVEKASTLSNLQITMRRNLFYIKGIITTGVIPIKKERIDIITSEGERIASTLSGNNGYFEFFDIPASEGIFIKSAIEGYQPFSSDEMSLDKNIENFTIILNNNNEEAVILITNEVGDPYRDTSLLINNTAHVTDHNGMLYLSLESGVASITLDSKKQDLTVDKNNNFYRVQF